MPIRTVYYLTCADCNNQFHDPRYGAYFGSEDEVKQQAAARGWHLNVRVANGSEWDFCPRCWVAHLAESHDTHGSNPEVPA